MFYGSLALSFIVVISCLVYVGAILSIPYAVGSVLGFLIGSGVTYIALNLF